MWYLNTITISVEIPMHTAHHRDRLIDDLSVEQFGLSRTDAHAQSICVSCKRPASPSQWTDLDNREYRLSALCPSCFDSITREDSEGSIESDYGDPDINNDDEPIVLRGTPHPGR